MLQVLISVFTAAPGAVVGSVAANVIAGMMRAAESAETKSARVILFVFIENMFSLYSLN